MGGRPKLLIAVAAVAIGALAGVVIHVLGGDEPAEIVLPQPVPQGSHELASALEQLEATPGARFTAVMTVIDPQLGRKPVRLKGRGVFNCDGDVRLNVSYLPVLRRADPGASLDQLGLVKKDLLGEIVSAGDDLYFRLPALQKLFPTAKPWIHAVDDGGSPGAMGLLGRGDPDCDDFLPYLEYGLREPGIDDTAITAHRDETIRGRTTTHYVLSVSPAEIATAFEVTIKDLDRALRLLGGGAFDIDFWIDENGLLRRVSYQDVWPGEKGETPTEGRFTLDFTDYGVDFDAAAPASPKTMEEPAFDRLVAQAA